MAQKSPETIVSASHRSPACLILVILKVLDLKDIHFSLQTFAQIQVMCADLKPTVRSLIEVQSPANLDYPAMIKLDLPVVHIGMKPDVQHDIEFEETLLQLAELVLEVSQLGLIIIVSDQRDLLDSRCFDDHFAEADKVLDLVR